MSEGVRSHIGGNVVKVLHDITYNIKNNLLKKVFDKNLNVHCRA